MARRKAVTHVRWTSGSKADSTERFEARFTGQEDHMQQTVLVIGAVLLGAGVAYGQAETPGIDQRQANQEQRIDQGITNGQLTQHETNKLEKQQQHIDTMENKAKSDGVVTKKERARIHAAQDKASKNIFRQKHDRQKSRHQ